MTRIIIEPYAEQVSSTQNEQNYVKLEAWSDIFQVDFTNELNTVCDGILQRCTNLTKCEIKGNNTDSIERYLVSLQAIKSPIQSISTKESGTAAMKKFLNTIESCYPRDYLSLYDSNRVIYAILDAVKFKPVISVLASDNYPVVKMSSFLQQKIGLFELSPKVLLKAKSTSLNESKLLLDKSQIKNISIKTNYCGEVSFSSIISSNSNSIKKIWKII